MDAKAFWTQVHDIASRLPGDFVYLTSLDCPMKGSPGGQVIEVERRRAARCIAEGTHRLSTEAEVEERRQQDEQLRAEYREAERLRRELAIGFVPPPPPAPAPDAKPKK